MRGRGGFGPRHRGGWPIDPRAFFPPEVADNIEGLARHFFGGEPASKDTDFSPAVDLFNTLSHFIVHVSLPGAKKEDVAVDWDIETRSLKVSGIVYRPGVDEEMLNALVRDERKVGFFERKIQLDETRFEGKVDDEADITAKLEDGVLVVRVPKVVEQPKPKEVEIEKEKETEKDAEMTSETEKGDYEEEREPEQEDETEYVRVEVE